MNEEDIRNCTDTERMRNKWGWEKERKKKNKV